MFRVNRLFCFWALIFLCGCHRDYPEVPLTTAVTTLEKQLEETHSVSVSNIDTWKTADTAQFVTSVKALQCAGNVSDPIIPIFTAPVKIMLSGSFHNGASAELDVLSNAAEPKFTISSSQDKTTEITMPITFSALDTLPDVIFGIERKRLDGILDSPYHGDATFTELDHLKHNRDMLARTIRLIMDDYDPQQCGADTQSNSLYMGAHKLRG